MRKLIGRSTIFVLAEFLQMGASFFLLPLYTSRLSTADYGVIALTTTLSGVFGILLMQSSEAMFNRYYYICTDEDKRKSFYGATWPVFSFYALAICLLIDLLGKTFGERIFPGVPYQPYLQFTLWTAFLKVTTFSLPRAIFLAREAAWSYASITISSFFISTVLIIYFVAVRNEGALGNVRGAFFGALVVAIPSIVITLRNIKPNWNWQHLRTGLVFALPITPHLLSTWALNLADRFVLQQFVPLSDIGIYAFGYQVASIVQVIAYSIATALSPYFLKTATDNPNAPAILSRMATYYIAVVVWGGLGMIALSGSGIKLVALRPEYYAALAVIPWVVAGSVVRGYYFIFLDAVYFSKNLRVLPMVTFGAALGNIVLNLLLVPQIGYIAAAITTFLCFAAQAVVMGVAAQRLYWLPYEWRRLVIVTLMGLIWAVLLSMFTLPNIWLDLVIKGVLALAFPLLLGLIGFFSRDEIDKLLTLRPLRTNQ